MLAKPSLTAADKFGVNLRAGARGLRPGKHTLVVRFLGSLAALPSQRTVVVIVPR